MKKHLLLLLCCLHLIVKGQIIDTLPNIEEAKSTDNNMRIFDPKRTQPEYPGGQDELFKYLNKNVPYPKKELKNKVHGRVTMAFYIEADGSIGNIYAIHSPSKGLTQVCIRGLKNCKFKPAMQMGHSVRVQYIVPIIFDVDHPNDRQYHPPSAW